jgi:hypothetical protein
MVKVVHLEDESNFLMLTAGYLPDREGVRAAMPRHPDLFRRKLSDFSSLDLAAAWTLSALARRSLWAGRNGKQCGGATALRIPLETWLLGDPTNPSARFASWFREEPDQTAYRLVVHRTPLLVGQCAIRGPFWEQAYHSRHPLLYRSQHLERDQLLSGEAFLEELLAAYRYDSARAETVIRKTAHSYWRSGGEPAVNGTD